MTTQSPDATEQVEITVTEEMEDAGCEAFNEAIAKAKAERKARNDIHEAAGHGRPNLETGFFPVDWLAPVYRAMQSAALPSNATTTLYDAIKHGEDDHRAWLKEAIDAHFAGQPVPAPRGLGNKERRIAELEAQLAAKDATTNASLVEVLTKCRDKFLDYAQQHNDKADKIAKDGSAQGMLGAEIRAMNERRAKAFANRQMAEMCDATLRASNPDEEGKHAE